MNIWDSVQRGLEKASQGAERIAKLQRTRTQIEQLGRQMSKQEGILLQSIMDLYAAGLITQSDLIPICQDLLSTHQQLTQAQHELQVLQNQGTPTPPTTHPGNPSTPAPQSMYPIHSPSTDPSTQYAPPPPYQSTYIEPTVPVLPPPPPEFLTSSQRETMIGEVSTPHANIEVVQTTGTQTTAEPLKIVRCPVCGAQAHLDSLYCQSCGTALQQHMADHLPTVRSHNSSAEYPPIQQIPSASIQTDTDDATMRSENPPSPASTPLPEKDRG